MKKKIVLIYNFAQHYRTSIFRLIDDAFDAYFIFGDSMSDVKKMDYALLHGPVTETHTRRLFRKWYWQPKVVSSLFLKRSTYILLGETHALSTWVFLLLSRFFPKKTVCLWSHGWYGKETIPEIFMKKLFFRLPNGGTFLYGNYARQLMIEKGLNPNKLYVIHNSLAYDKQLSLRSSLRKTNVYQDHFGNDNYNLLFVGRLTKIKQLDLAIKALKQCKELGRCYNFTLVGNGVVKEEMERLVEEFSLENQVWFYGACYDEEELGKMIYNADVCVSPGNVGLTAMHSMVFGTPVITHDDFAHQMPEFEAIHEGITGSFFHLGDVDSLTETINNWHDTYRFQREKVRQACYHEIDSQWTPQFQISVIKKVLLAVHE